MNENTLANFTFSTNEINFNRIILNKIPKFTNSNVEIVIKKEDKGSDIDLLGHKRKRNIKKNENKNEKVKKPEKKKKEIGMGLGIKNGKTEAKKAMKEKKEKTVIKDKTVKKVKNVKNEKMAKKDKIENPENKEIKPQKERKEAQNQQKKKREKTLNNIEIEIDSFTSDADKKIRNEKSNEKNVKKNKKGNKRNRTMKKGDIRSNNPSNEDIRSIVSIRSISEGEGIDSKPKYYRKRNNKKKNNSRKHSNKVKNGKKENKKKEEKFDFNKNPESPAKNRDNLKSKSYNIKKKIITDSRSPSLSHFHSHSPSPSNINNSNINNDNNENNDSNPRGYISNTKSNNLSITKNMWGSSSPLENTITFSSPSEADDRIKLKKDPSYFYKYSRYMKYSPLDEFLPHVPFSQKKSNKSQIGKTEKIDFNKKNKKEKMKIEKNDENSDSSEISSLCYEGYEEEEDLPPILTIPRIKPTKDEHIKLIKDKLEKDGIKLHQTDNERIRKEEESLYIGSFGLYDEKNKIKVLVPVYKENEVMKQFLAKKNLKIIEFKEDNDVDTDDEQVELEIQRSNNALLEFMKKIEKDKDYLKKSLNRKLKE